MNMGLVADSRVETGSCSHVVSETRKALEHT